MKLSIAQDYTTLVSDFIKENGGIFKTNQHFVEMELPTKADILRVYMIIPKDMVDMDIFMTYTCFENPDKGYQLTGNSNKFSGKYNFSLSSKDVTAEQAFEVFKTMFENIL